MDEYIQNVFSIKIFRKIIQEPVVSNIQNEIKNIDNNNELKNYMMLERPHGIQTETNHPYMSDSTGTANFIKEHNLIHLETEILNNAKEFIYKTNYDSVSSFNNFRITNSQVIYFPTNFSGMPHVHIPGKLSGVYYFKTKNTAGNFRLISPNFYSYDVFATDSFYEVVPTDGVMMIWPCWLMHEVLPNISSEMRISISFQVEFDTA